MKFSLHTKPADLNLKGFLKRKRNRALKRNALKAKFEKEITKIIPLFFQSTANQNLTISQSQTEALLNWIDDYSNGLDQKKYLNNYLSNMLDFNRQSKNWECPRVARIFNLPRERNLFNPMSFGKVNATREELKILESSITAPLELGNTATNILRLYKWGQVLASAVFYGGVLDKNALISVLVNPRPKLLKSLVQLTLFDDDNPRWLLAAGLKRTWFVDPVTLQLLKDLPVKELPPIIHETLNENITWAIKALNYFFKLTAEACGIEHKKITSLSSWLEAHQTRLALNLPPYLLHFAAGKHKTTSLSEHTYLRLTENKYLGIAQSRNNDEFDNWTTTFNQLRFKKTTETGARVAEKALRESLYVSHGAPKPSPHATIAKLNLAILQHQETAPEIVIALAEWISRKLDVNDEQSSNKGITPSTAYEYFTSLSGGLIEHLGREPLSNYDIDHFIGSYEEILDSLNPSASTKLGIAQRLRQFHRHLVLNHNVRPIDFQILDDDCFITAADANLVTNIEYQKILTKLDRLCTSRTTNAVRSIFILSYRCGLRISEVQNIRFCDFQLDINSPVSKIINTPVSLLIRNTPFNNLKTTESRRILPLHMLIPKDELHIVLAYLLKEYSDTTAPSNRPIFTAKVEGSSPIDRLSIYTILNPLMREATKDGNVRFHHLRHSFANNLALGFLCSPERLGLLNGFDPFYLDLRKQLLSEHINQRSWLFQIATWMGHASPQTTIKSYIHVCDFLLADSLYPYTFSIKKRGLGAKSVFGKDLNPGLLLTHLLDLPQNALLIKSNKQKTVPQFIANRPTPLKDHAACLKAYLPIPEEWRIKESRLKSLKDMDICHWVSVFEFLKIGKTYTDIFEILEIEKPNEVNFDKLLYSLFCARANQRFKQSALIMRLESRKHSLQLSNKVIYLITPPRGSCGRYIANIVYQSLIESLKKRANDIREFFEIYIKHFNQDHREIRFQRGEELVYKKFICLVQSWLPKEMILKEDYELYKESARYWIAVKFKPTEVGTPEGEAAHSLHFAVLVAFIHSKISVG